MDLILFIYNKKYKFIFLFFEKMFNNLIFFIREMFTKKLENKREGRGVTQIKLFDESDENKNIGLMVKDIKINENFLI